MALAAGLAAATVAAAAEPDKEDIDLERTVVLEVRLIDVERVAGVDGAAIARFRVESGAYAGSLFSLAYRGGRPIRVESWHVHDQAGYRRIGGARVQQAEPVPWDSLFRPGSDEPLSPLRLTLIQTDLNEDERRRRWHFTAIALIEPPRLPGSFAPGDDSGPARGIRDDRRRGAHGG